MNIVGNKEQIMPSKKKLSKQHHSQKAPTQWAYDQACKALHKHRERAEKLDIELKIAENNVQMLLDALGANFPEGNTITNVDLCGCSDIEVKITSDKVGWYVADCKCRVCNKEHIGVFPDTADSETLECSRCHLMEAEAIKYYETDDGIFDE